jgi:hypothetical protein
MQAWASLAQQAGWLTARVDGRTVGLAPQAFAAAVESAASANKSRSDGDGAGPSNLALFIDTYERLEPLDSWLRQQYCPASQRRHSTRLVSEGAPTQSPTETLRLLLRLDAEELNTHPTDPAPCGEASPVRRTYVQPTRG